MITSEEYMLKVIRQREVMRAERDTYRNRALALMRQLRKLRDEYLDDLHAVALHRVHDLIAAEQARDGLASTITSQRSEIDTLRADSEEARELLEELFAETGYKQSYTARDGGLHPGATSTIKAVWECLYGKVTP